jgi:hypothetical protein
MAQVSIFAIVTLIIVIMELIFLVLSAIYFYRTWHLQPPSISESTILFWTSLVFIMLCFGLAIYCLFHIFYHTEKVAAVVVSTPSFVQRNDGCEYSTPSYQSSQVIPMNQVILHQTSAENPAPRTNDSAVTATTRPAYPAQPYVQPPYVQPRYIQPPYVQTAYPQDAYFQRAATPVNLNPISPLLVPVRD